MTNQIANYIRENYADDNSYWNTIGNQLLLGHRQVFYDITSYNGKIHYYVAITDTRKEYIVGVGCPSTNKYWDCVVDRITDIVEAIDRCIDNVQ